MVSVQVLCEFFVRSTRQGDAFMRVEEAESIVKNLSNNWEIIAPDINQVMAAMRGRRAYQLSFWDALIWAAAKSAGVKMLYTEDFQHGRIIEGVRFINPFKDCIG